jgi:MATE family, multidrug efflux pump
MTDEAPTPAPAQQPRTDRTAWITEGSLSRAVWRLSLPMTATMLFHNLFVLTDMYFVGQLPDSGVALAAVGASGVLMGVIHMLAMGVTTGCAAFVANAVGRGDRARAQKIAAQSLLLSATVAVAVGALGVPLAGPFLRMLGIQSEVVTRGVPYIQIMTGGAFTSVLAFTFGSALRGVGDARTPLLVITGANLLNVFLDWVLIFGNLGMPRMEVAGSALATVIARGAALLVLAWIFFGRGHEHFHLRLADLRPDFPVIRQIARMGCGASGEMLIRNTSALLIIKIVAVFGTVPLAAYTVGLRLWMMVLMPGMGFGNAAGTILGQSVGAGRPERGARGAWMAAGMYAAICALVAVGYWVFADALLGAFTRNPQPGMVATGAEFLRWVAPTFVFMAVSITLGRAMNGAGDTLMPLIVTFLTVIVVRLPMAWGLSQHWDDVSGVWLAFAVSSVVQGLLFMAAFKWGRWKRAILPGGSKEAGVEPTHTR